MKRLLSLLAVVTLVSPMINCSRADAAPGFHVNRRQARQQARIDKGIANGQLTGREATRLQAKETRLAAQEQRMRASGGGLSRKEHIKLKAEQNALNRRIRHQKHDAQKH